MANCNIKKQNALFRKVEKLRPDLGTSKSSKQYKQFSKASNQLIRLKRKCSGVKNLGNII